jgi:hypothetical protein
VSWLSSIFHRGDVEAAQQAIDSAIYNLSAPNTAQIAAETQVKLAKVEALASLAVAAHLRTWLEMSIVARVVDLSTYQRKASILGMAPEARQTLLNEVLSEQFAALMKDVLEDNMVDPEEDQRIAEFLEMLGDTPMAHGAAKLIEDGRRLFRACSDPLSPKHAPVLLRSGEYCVHAATAEAFEDRSRTVRVGYHGPRARIRIAKGLYYTMGSSAVSRQTEEYSHSFGTGVLCVTNMRLMWISPARTISTPLHKIIRYDPFSDGLKIFKDSGKPLLFIWADDGKVATILATRAIEELR